MKNKTLIVVRALKGEYNPTYLQLTDSDIPTIGNGNVLIKSILLSLDPTNINWMKLDPALQAISIRQGDPMVGVGIGIIQESRSDKFIPGQVVTGLWRWQEYAEADPAYIQPALPNELITYEHQLALFSHIGRAAIGGMVAVGEIKSSDAVLISGAAGATGSIAGQIAKAYGCYTVGIAGGQEKCQYLVDELGFDGAIDYRSENLQDKIARYFPKGIDLFFDNVGGRILDIVLQNMADRCRIALCGAISQYNIGNEDKLYGIKHLPLMLFRRARMEGFIAGDFGERNAELDDLLLQLFHQGKLKTKVHVVEGFENIPASLSLLLSGKNQGKLIGRVGLL